MGPNFKLVTLTLAMILAFVVSALDANAISGAEHVPHAQAHQVPGHDPIGEPGDVSEALRTIQIDIEETQSGYMLFKPDAIHIEHGTVVRFSITNSGTMDHEFFLGSFDEVQEHLNWMRKNPNMTHDSGNAVSVPPGETKELVWSFSNITNLEFVCLIPGHREAGMFGVIMVHDHLAPRSNG